MAASDTDVTQPGTPADPDAAGRLSRATAGMAVATFFSRLTGFGRVVALAYAFGFTRLSDSYNLANTTPNIIYDLVLGGIMASFIIPVFVEHLTTRDEDESWEAISVVVTTALLLLVGITLLFVVIAPAVIRLYSFRLHGQQGRDQQAVATALLRMFAPQILFYGMTALVAAVLNARRRFVLPMAVPVLNNVVVIAVLLIVPHMGRSLDLHSVRGDTGLLLFLGLGTTLGVAVQAVALVPALRRVAPRLRWRWDLRHAVLGQVLRLSGWTFGYVISNQVAFWIALVLANGTAGGISAYSAAYIFFQLPYGILAVSILTALTPDMAERWSRRDLEGFRRRLGTGIRTGALVLLPAAVGYLVLARPLVSLLLEHGSFTKANAQLTADVLVWFSVGLPFFSLYLLFVRGYTAMQDTRTPFLINLGENVLLIALDVVLYPAMGVSGLALGFTISYVAAAGVAAWDLRRRTGGLADPGTSPAVARTAVATAVMAAVVVPLSIGIVGEHGWLLAARVLGSVAAGVVAFVLVARALGVDELTTLTRQLLRRAPCSVLSAAEGGSVKAGRP
ncbi:MAG: murein biosynthesis integral membrane protein MurJ [Acidimicrobiia bacterium]|nr:murein biosynthesis integral membrane protein MurJ [Acidimicrobiia bacterium]